MLRNKTKKYFIHIYHTIFLSRNVEYILCALSALIENSNSAPNRGPGREFSRNNGNTLSYFSISKQHCLHISSVTVQLLLCKSENQSKMASKVCVIFGAGQKMGYSLARQWAKNGYKGRLLI